jgi:class 3 adenylate cyclase
LTQRKNEIRANQREKECPQIIAERIKLQEKTNSLRSLCFGAEINIFEMTKPINMLKILFVACTLLFAWSHILGKSSRKAVQVAKIKTIGDAYMVAGGLHSPQKSHAKDVVIAVLATAEVVLLRNEHKTSQ